MSVLDALSPIALISKMPGMDSITGKSQQRDITAAKQRADAALTEGYTTGRSDYERAGAMFQPYANTGGNAMKMYADATGVNGQPAYDAAAGNFMTGDPFRRANEDFANQNLAKTFNARGGLYSGNAMLAASRGSLERGSTDWNNWLNRLSGQADQGFKATGSTAAIATGQGDMANNYGQTRAGNEISYGNAMAGSRSTLMNNLLSIAGVAAKAMAPSPVPR